MGKVFAYKNRILFVAIAVAVLASFLSLGVVAGSHTPVDGVTVGVSGSTSDSISSGVVTVTAKGSGGLFGIGASAKTATITIYNSGAEKATVSFDWVATDVNSLKIDDTVMSEAKGTVSKLLEPDSSFTIIITTAKNATVNTLVMKNFARNEYKASNITVEFDSTLGSVTAGTQTLKNGEAVTVTAATDFIANSSNFVAWVDNENNLLSYDKTLTINPEGSVTVKALFHKSAHFEVDNKVYSGLSAAILATSGANSKTIILLNSASLPAGEYTIPSGVTLLIPYDAKNTLCTTKPTLDGTTGFLTATANSWKTPTVFRKLTMESGAHITVNGAISLSGKMCFVQGSNGMPTGATSVISMESGSSITVNSGGNLYAWGYVIGNGEVTVESKGTVYENFQLRDWRGGDAVSKMLDKAEKVFPASQYYVQNIEVKMTLKAGAVENAYMALVASKCFADATVPFVGANGMFRLTNGCLVKDYLEAEDRLQVDIDGDLSMSALVISAKTDLKNFDLNSAKYVLPITNNLFVNVVSGTTVISQDMAFLPGSELIIKENATVEVAEGVSVFVYDINEWAEKKYVFSDCDVSPLKFVGATWKAPKARPTMGDAKIEVNGTLDASLGYLFTTTGGANICSTGAGKVITTGAYKTDDKGKDITITYQYIQSSSSYDEILITPAKLQNEDGTYVETSSTSTTVTSYNHAHYTCTVHGDTVENSTNAKCGAWHAGDPKEEVSGLDATCTENGSKTYTCSCAHSYTVTINALGHTEVIDAAKAATCTETGLTQGKHCSVCDAIITAQSVIAALGHTRVTDVEVAPTCTETGLTEGCHCSVCNEILAAQEVIDALGHTEVTDDAVAPTCTTTGLTDGTHCSVCNEILTAQEVIAALGHAWNWGGWSSATNGQQCTCTCGNDDSHTITVLLAYRMDSYIWLNATVSYTADKPVCNQVELQSDGTYTVKNAITLQADRYIVQKVLSNHITDSVLVAFDTAEPLEIGFLAYSTLLKAGLAADDPLYKLLVAMEEYGKSAGIYFDPNDTTSKPVSTKPTDVSAELLNPAKDNASYGEKGLNGLTISTTGAAFYFDEALRLSVGYRFADGVTVNLDENGNPDGTITFGDTTYTVLQVGLLVQELEELDDKWTMCDVLYAKNGVTAYIAYDNSASLESGRVDEEGNQENHPDVGPGGPDAFVNTLGASGEINFDLLVTEYKKGFALRTYAVLKDANGTQYVIYGKQYGYGLEAYVNAMYDTEASGDQFNSLLATAWEYAKAAATKYPEVK